MDTTPPSHTPEHGKPYWYVVRRGIADTSATFATEAEAQARARQLEAGSGEPHSVGMSIPGAHRFQLGYKWVNEAMERGINVGTVARRTKSHITLLMLYEQWCDTLAAARRDIATMQGTTEHRPMVQAAVRVVKNLTSSPSAPQRWLDRDHSLAARRRRR